MRILLVRTKWKAPDYDAPLGLAILAAIARDLGHVVKIVDLNMEQLPIDKCSYDIVGITGYTGMKYEILQIAKQFPNQTVVVGGPWAADSPEEVLASSLVDYVCMCEGEIVWRKFLEAYPNVEDIEGIGSPTKLNPLPEPILDLDSLPLPAWEIVDLKRYARVPIWTSRGCPMRCIFCNIYKFYGRKWRARSVENVLVEVEWLVKKFGIHRLSFVDDNPTWNPSRFKQICQGIIDRKLNVVMDTDAGTRVDKLPDDLLETMAEAGFKRVQLNPESGCQRVLDEVIHKGLNLDYLFPVVKKCLELGIGMNVCFVIGFPWETKEEVLQTVDVAHKLRAMGCTAYVGNAVPYQNTELYRKAKAEGFLLVDGEELYDIAYRHARVRSVHCLSSHYWTPGWLMQVHQRENRLDAKETFKRYAFTKRGFLKAVRNPAFVVRKLRAAF